jgi:diguanylate cyclase (GGDEF)-like protein
VLEYKTQLNNSNSTGKTRRELRPALVFLSGDLIAVPIPLEREEVILGRALEADVRINDAQVSRLHAKINRVYDAETNEIAYRLKDLGSKNGTLINGQPIVEEFLQNGDKIEVGGVLLRFELVDEIDREYQRQIHRLLSHDELTGLLTSRSFFSELRREAARARLENRPFCVLMMDIDHFKSVNDTYGHLTGSKTLEEVGFCITRALRTGDVASRFGGEEFAAFLLDAELKQGIVAAERVRSLIEKHPFTITRQSSDSPTTHHITISIGVASFPDDGLDPIELIEKADSALYRAKRDGRNCVRTHRELTPEELSMPFPARLDFENTGSF